MTSTRLYPELYLAIFDRLDRAPRRKTALRNLSMTSRLFRELAEPLLFNKILLKTDYSESGMESRTRTLIHHLTNRAETRHWVKSVEITTYSTGDNIQKIADIFAELYNLRDIIFEQINLTDNMVRHLLRLSHPFSLTCLNVGCPGNAENLVSDTRNLQITELIVDRLRRPNMIRLATRLALGPRLSALKIEEHDSTELYPSFLHNPGHKFDSLRHLQVFQPVEEADMTNFLSFLASCPQLSHLKISHSYSSRPKPAFLLPPTSIPHLSFFDAPYGIARLLVHGRPVLSLKLRCAVKSDLQRETLSQLAEGSTPLRGLDVDHVEWRDDVLLDVAEYFPALQDLKLRVVKYDYCNLLLKRLDSDMKRLPSMQRFFIYNFTARRPEEDFGSDTLRLLEVTNDRLTSIGFRLKTERYRDERRWVLLPLSQI